MNIDKHFENFKRIFNTDTKLQVFFAPGRVNLIGEHIDYHEGKVLPCAINYGTYLFISKRTDNKILGYSYNFGSVGIKETDLNNITKVKSDRWFNYPKGIVKNLIDNTYKIDSGFNLYFYGNIPNGAGLSSSASIELVTIEALKHLFKLDLSKKEMVSISKYTENKFIGVNCGIMDQYAVCFGKKGKAILLDCKKIDHEYIDLKMDGYSIVITNTNVKRELEDSAYNERRIESFKGLEILKRNFNIENLIELSMEDIKQSKDLFDDLNIYKRVRHVVSENKRTIEASKKLQQGNIDEFGKLMNHSHQSLRDDFEVSCRELDFLVDKSLKINGVIGSRMTGAGFGGCTVSIVKDEEVDKFIEIIETKYSKEFNLKPSIYMVESSQGSHKIY